MANRMATLHRRVTQCREQMGLSRSGGPNQNGTAVLLDEVAVEQAHDRGLGIRLGNLKSYSARDFCLGSRALRSRRSRARCSRAARSSPNRIARTPKKELPLRAASSST